MTEKTRVLFRAERSGPFKGDVTAVFCDIPGTNAHNTTCYSHIGQHSACALEWYHTTRPAKPHEYEALKHELETYGPPDARYVLEIRQRMPADARARRRAALREKSDA